MRKVGAYNYNLENFDNRVIEVSDDELNTSDSQGFIDSDNLESESVRSKFSKKGKSKGSNKRNGYAHSSTVPMTNMSSFL